MSNLLALLVCLLAAASQLALAQPGTKSYCDNLNVEPCALRVNRDIMFLVDGSNSMSMSRFYGDVLNYTLALYCSFPEDLSNKAGMLLFNARVDVIIPLKGYTRNEWYNEVWKVKNTEGTANAACCSCCTPTGDAFRRANEEFDRFSSNAVQMAFVITDGLPSNNNIDTGGYPEWWFNPATLELNPATYNVKSVPEGAWTLKSNNRRIILVGVPNALNERPEKRYFDGGYANGYRYCLNRVGKQFCDTYYTQPTEVGGRPNFPLVSLPVEENSFSTGWDDPTFVPTMVDTICYVAPTSVPTKLPTSQAPTKQPTLAPTKLPTSKTPTLAPTKLPTKLPTLAPTKLPTPLPTLSPTRPALEQVDLTFLVDRSNSMNYVPELCTKVLNTFPSTGEVHSDSPCWELWTQFLVNQVGAFANIAAGQNGERKLGWANDFAQNPSIPAKGLRVNVIGFACTNKQKTPKLFEYSLDLFGGPITNAADFQRLVDYMRTEILPTGGTCPHLAVEQAVKYVEAANVDRYPLQAVLLMTDGVTYDGEATPRATQGLFAYRALTFSVGISVARENNNYGLTPKEIKTQTEQLSAFVRGNPKYFYNLREGWSGLLGITETLADSLPSYFFSGDGKAIPRYTWCGFRRKHNCVSDNNRDGNCKWTGKADAQYKCGKA